MSSMAKIFVVVNLILGVAAFGSAATLLGAKEDYKAANEKLKTAFEKHKVAAQKEKDRLESVVASQKTVTSNATAAKQTAEDRVEDVTTQNAILQQTVQKGQATIENLATQLRTLTEANAKFDGWLKDFASEAKTATDEKLNSERKWQDEVKNRVRLENEVKKGAAELGTLGAKCGDIEKELRNCKFWLNKYRERFGDITGGPKGANGRVKAVKDDLVSISVGSDDGVRVGDTYQIRRGATYVGQIKITKVYKDQAVGRFDSEFKGPGAPVQTDDAAEARGW